MTQNSTSTSRRTDAGLAVLVVDPVCARRDLVVASLRACGRRADGVATTVQAMQELVSDEVHAVVVAPVLGSATGPDFLAFLAGAFPDVVRVLISEKTPLDSVRELEKP